MDIDNVSGLEIPKPDGVSPLYRFLIDDTTPLSPEEKIAVQEWLRDEEKFTPQLVHVGLGIVRLAETQKEYDEIMKDTFNVHKYAAIIFLVLTSIIWLYFKF